MLKQVVSRRQQPSSPTSVPRSLTRAIVCGVDESRASRQALRVAERLGERLALRLILAHALPLPLAVAYPEIGYASEPYDPETDVRAGHQLLDCAATNVDLEARAAHKVVFGKPAAALADVAEEEDADMIVVGSRRRSAWAAALHGSVAAALAASATRPCSSFQSGRRREASNLDGPAPAEIACARNPDRRPLRLRRR
jgi:universal stress protein G